VKQFTIELTQATVIPRQVIVVSLSPFRTIKVLTLPLWEDQICPRIDAVLCLSEITLGFEQGTEE
jgi:hypothetical protein